MKAAMRWALYLPALAIALGLVLWGDRNPSKDPESAASPRAIEPLATASTSAVSASDQAPRNAQGTAEDDMPIDLFAPLGAREVRASPMPPAPIAPPMAQAPVGPPPAPAPAPVDPTGGWVVIGKQRVQGGPWEAFLERDGQVWVVKAGDVVMQRFRVKRFEPPVLQLLDTQLQRTHELNVGEPE